MVSDGEKLVSDFDQFPNIYPHPFQTLFKGDRYVDIYQTISNFYPELLSKSLVLEIAIGIKMIKNKKDTDNLMIINVFCYF